MKSIPNALLRSSRFLIVGGFGFAILTILLYTFRSLLGLGYVSSWFLAMEISILFTFWPNTIWTWGDRWALDSALKRLWHYHVGYGFGFLVQFVVFYGLVRGMDLPYLVANLAAAVVGAAWNFSFHDRVTWRASRIGNTYPKKWV